MLSIEGGGPDNMVCSACGKRTEGRSELGKKSLTAAKQLEIKLKV